MSIFVSGSDGFIGSHVVEELVRQGKRVKALVQYNSFGSTGWLEDLPSEVFDSIEVVFGDVRDENGLAAAMQGCEGVLHLAALISIPYSYSHPGEYVQTNVVGTHNMLSAALRTNIQTFVQTSTSEVYGSAVSVPMGETHRLRAQSPYAASKIGADQLAMSYHLSFGLPVVVLRPFNTFGPRQSERAVISRLIRQFEQEATTIRIGNLNPTRDFTFVRDTARGFAAALAAPMAIGEVINLGAGFEISVGDVIKALASMYRRDPRVVQDSQLVRSNSSEVDRLFADNSRAKELLGWSPLLSGKPGFIEGLKETIDWHRERFAKAPTLPPMSFR